MTSLRISSATAPQPSRTEIGVIDTVPAAMLLLPYFEADLDNPTGITTLVSVNNASLEPVLVHLALWTDWGIPG